MENLYLKHGLISRTYYKNSLIMASIEGWDETKEFAKPVKAIATPQGIPKTPDRRLLELEDQINFLLNGLRPAPLSSSTHNPQAYVNAAYLSSSLKNHNESPILNSFASRECTGLTPPPQALETTFEARREEINGRMTEMFRLLKELTTSKAPEKVLIREETKSPVTKNVNSIYLEVFNDSGAQVSKVKGKTYNVSPKGPVYDAILKKKITKKEDIGGNFEIPCSIEGLKHVNALVDQGFDVNVMPYSTYIKLTDERPAETNIRLSLASHSYIYPLGIVEDVLVDVAEHVYPVDFVILDIKEDEKRPFILEYRS
ncbi:zinc finger, CCHC-type containing protein [Tanacetum coccineum]